MTDEQQNDNPMPTPPPLPGQVFVRPGIDDRPDLDKALTPEDKAALARLTVRQNPRQPEASGDRPEVQAAQMSAEGAPMAAAARIDTAVPNLESSFLDLRDPMVDADGYRPSATEMTRMNIGFALGAVLCAAPLGALNTVLVPVLVDRLAGAGRTLPLALLVVGAVQCRGRRAVRPYAHGTRTTHAVDSRRRRRRGAVHAAAGRSRECGYSDAVVVPGADRVCDAVRADRRRVRRTHPG